MGFNVTINRTSGNAIAINRQIKERITAAGFITPQKIISLIDVDVSGLANGKIMVYDSSDQKFKFQNLDGGSF